MVTIGVARIGNEPALRYTATNDPVIELNLACHYGKKDRDGKRATQWIKATLWGKRAESLAPYLVKGQQVHVQLIDVHVEIYTKKDGTTGASMVARINELEFVGERTEQKPVEKPVVAKDFAELDDDLPWR